MRRMIAAIVVSGLTLGLVAARRGDLRALAEPRPETNPTTRTFQIDGIERRALIYRNSAAPSSSGAPLVFVFHGHGGNAQAIARKLRVHELWPEAVVLYMQGIPGIRGITDAEGVRNGWQKNPGEAGDRDIKFTDAALVQIQKEFKIDSRRVYAMGHSNGARFVNVLWNTRGDKFAAFCSASGQGGVLIQTAIPKPIFVIAGEKDPLVPFEGQKMSVELIRKKLETSQAKASTNGYLRLEPGKNGTELAAYLHPGGHEFPVEAMPLVVEFFKRHPAS
jgi:polyhydroxybutyrate depolymerase